MSIETLNALDSSTNSHVAFASVDTPVKFIGPRSSPRTVVWGERSMKSQRRTSVAEDRRKPARRTAIQCRVARSSFDRSRPDKTEMTYGRPGVAVSRATSQVPAMVPDGRLSKALVGWTIVLGTGFGLFGSMLANSGESLNQPPAPAFASYSTQ